MKKVCQFFILSLNNKKNAKLTKYAFFVISILVIELIFNTTTQIVFAQTPELRIEGIQNAEIDVSISPEFNIITNFKIDTSHFRMNPEQIIRDSISIPPDSVYYFDSVIAVYSYAPNIILIDEETYLNQEPDYWPLYTEFGNYNLLNDTTIEINSYSLKNSTKYYLIVRDVWIINNNDTLICDTNSIYFTTQKPLINLVKTNIEKSIKCSEVLYAEFSEKLDSVATPFGSILQFYKIDSCIYHSNNQKEEVLTEIYPDISLSQDSTKLLIEDLNDLNYNDKYYGKVNMEYLTGDSLSNLYFEFWFNRKVKVKIVTDGISSKVPPYFLDSLTLNIGDTLKFEPYQITEGKQFNSWTCIEDSSKNNSTRLLQFVAECSDLDEITLTANYEDIGKDTIVITNYNTSGIIKVYDKDHTYLGGTGTYFIDRIPRKQLSVYFDPADSTQFDEWNSTIPAYDGDKFPYIEIFGGEAAYSQLDPVIEARIDTYILNVKVAFTNNGYESKYHYEHEISDYVDISPAMDVFDPDGNWMSKIITSSNPNFEQEITADIIPDGCGCYKLYSLEGDVSTTFKDGYNTGGPYRTTWEDIINFQGPKKDKYILILVDRKLVEYEAELIAKNDGIITENRDLARLDISSSYPSSESNELLEGRLEEYYRDEYKEYFKYSIKCPQTVIINTVNNLSYLEFSKYNDEVGFYCGDTPNEHFLGISQMTEDYTSSSGKKIQAIFDEPFAITSISFNTQDYYFNYSSYEVTNIFNDNIALFNRFPEYGDLNYNFKNVKRIKVDPTSNTAIITINFNSPVNTSTIEDVGNFWIEDCSSRIDFPTNPQFNQKFYYYPQTSLRNFIWSNNNQTLQFTAKMKYDVDIYYNTPKFELLKLIFTNNIKDDQDRGLSCYKNNKTELYALTEFPLVKVYVEEIKKVKANRDFIDNLFWSEYYGIFIGYKNQLINGNWQYTYSHGYYPFHNHYSVLGGLFNDYENANVFMMETPVVSFFDTSLDFSAVFYEHDCGELPHLFPGFEDEIEEYVDNRPTDINVWNLEDLFRPYLNKSDDFAGSNNRTSMYLFDSEERWGTWNSFNQEVSFQNNNCTCDELKLVFKVIIE